jgi:hypothetical protein
MGQKNTYNLKKIYVYPEAFMPKKKLTLSVEEEAIRNAREFAGKHGTSISRLVSIFLSSLTDAEGPDTPIVNRLCGVLNSDARIEDYHEYLGKKYSL